MAKYTWHLLEISPCVHEFSAEKVVIVQSPTLKHSSAGQLGRKLREWGVYKYDSKNRRSSPALSATTTSSLPQAVPIMLVDAELEDSAMSYLQAIDASALAPPAANSSAIRDADSDVPPGNEASATENTGTDVRWCMEKSKSGFTRPV
jgi:hypothetical protein